MSNKQPLEREVKILAGNAWKSSGFSKQPKGLPIVRIQNVTDGSSVFVYWPSKYDQQFIINDGDILLSLSGNVKLCVWNRGKALLNQRVVKLTPSEKYDRRYFFWAMNRSVSEIEALAKYAVIANVSISDLKELKIPLPPLKEQRRIAAILDKADAIRRKRQWAIELTETFLRSVFLDMFGDPVTNPKGWDEGVLGDLILAAKDGPHVSPKYSSSGVPFLSTRNIRKNHIVWEDLKYISPEEAKNQWKKCKPERGDVLYTKGGTTGIATPIDFDEEIAVWVHVALLKTNHQKTNPVWLSAMLNSPYCYAQSQNFTHGATNKDLGLTRMVKIGLPIPPLQQQMKFAKIVAKVKKNTDVHKLSFCKADSLFSSLIQQAFKSELTQPHIPLEEAISA